MEFNEKEMRQIGQFAGRVLLERQTDTSAKIWLEVPENYKSEVRKIIADYEKREIVEHAERIIKIKTRLNRNLELSQVPWYLRERVRKLVLAMFDMWRARGKQPQMGEGNN